MIDEPLSFMEEQPEEPATEVPAAREETAAPEASTGEPLSAPPAEEKQQAIPITALLDEREKRQAAEREAAELRAWRKQQEEAARAKPVQAPDFYNDPDQRLAYERQQFQQALIGTKLEQSRFLAERDFGKEEVEAAYSYFDQHPQLSHQFLNHPSPFHAAVEFYKRQRVAEEIGSDPMAYRAKIEAEIREKLLAEIQQQAPVQPKPRPPGSLASAPAAGKAGEPRPRGSAFDAAFGG